MPRAPRYQLHDTGQAFYLTLQTVSCNLASKQSCLKPPFKNPFIYSTCSQAGMCHDTYGEVLVPCVYTKVGATVCVASEDNLGKERCSTASGPMQNSGGLASHQLSLELQSLYLPNTGITSIQTTPSQMFYF